MKKVIEVLKKIIFFYIPLFNFFFCQAIAYVLNACADQAEILNNLESGQKPYNIQTLFKKCKRDLIEPAMVAHLGHGSRLHLSEDTEDIKKNMLLYNNIKHLIWETELSIFGKVVFTQVWSIN